MFFTYRFVYSFATVGALLTLYILWDFMLIVGLVALCALIIATLINVCSLYNNVGFIDCDRICPDRLSNGDDNTIVYTVTNNYNFPVRLYIIDELPDILQIRNYKLFASLDSNETKQLNYNIKPRQRGAYLFRNINVYVSPIRSFGLIERRFIFSQSFESKTYPSFSFIKNMEFLSIENRLRVCGMKNVRRIGHSTEFEQIKEYVRGDDYRTINWKASARRHLLMCNVFDDEQSQYIYSIIDKGRGMQQTFDGMTQLDYAINATLSLSYVALQHNDNAGLITFETKVDSFVAASKKINQMEALLFHLYNEQSSFKQSHFNTLFEFIKYKINKRSLLIIYSNFDTIPSVRMQLPFLQKIAANHVVLVVFFLDTEMKALINHDNSSTQDYFNQTVAEYLDFERRLIVNDLQRHGIYTLLTSPKQLTVNVVNAYIGLKARNVI